MNRFCSPGKKQIVRFLIGSGQKRFPGLILFNRAARDPLFFILYGLFGALSNWDNIMPLIAKSCHCVALHLPIRTAHKREVKIEALGLFVEFFIRKREFGPVVVCGNSPGGHIALRPALNAPDLVKSMPLSGSSGLYEHTFDSLPVGPGESFISKQTARAFFNLKV